MIPIKSISDLKAISGKALMEIGRAPLIMSANGVYREVVIKDDGMICKVTQTDTLRIQIVVLIEELQIGKENICAEYSFEKQEWNVKTILPNEQANALLDTKEVDFALAALYQELYA